MLTVVTGAAGFVGSALVRRMAESHYPGTVRLVDRTRCLPPAVNFQSIAADLGDRAELASLVRGADRIIHLAALPGGAAEDDAKGSRQINLDLLLNLIDAVTAAPRPVRLVHASSVAVFGAPLPPCIDDDTDPRPASTYGAHKRMAEIALADATRRGAVDGISLRLPAIVARPRGAAGFASSFISDIFWAIVAGEPSIVPVAPEATLWLMSARRCADNLLHAAACPLPDWHRRALTLPALHVRIVDLVETVACVAGGSADAIAYAPDPRIEAQFGRLPALRTRCADALGLRSDGGLHALVRAVLARARGPA